MAKKSIASMSVEALIELRDQITNVLSTRASELRRQLARLGGADRPVRRKGRSPAKRGKVAAKYRGPNGETWSAGACRRNGSRLRSKPKRRRKIF